MTRLEVLDKVLNRESLEDVTTRQLLKMKSDFYPRHDTDHDGLEMIQIVNAELDKREHIPNKIESKAARIARKKSGISRKKA